MKKPTISLGSVAGLLNDLTIGVDMNNTALTQNVQPTMTSREIADLTSKRHDNVKSDIQKMVTELEIDVLTIQGIYFDSMNRKQTEYHLDRDLTDCLLTGYSAKARMAVIKRWRELEGHIAAPALPNFADPIEAAEAWIEAKKAERLAIATKAEIGTRREATAMNTASIATRRASKLERDLDRSKEYCTIKRMSMLTHGQAYNWRLLKSASQDMGIPPIDVFDANYGTVKAYHADVWMEAYGLEVAA